MFWTRCSIVGFQNVSNFFPNTMLSSYLWALLRALCTFVHWVHFIGTQQAESGTRTPSIALARGILSQNPIVTPPPPPTRKNPILATPLITPMVIRTSCIPISTFFFPCSLEDKMSICWNKRQFCTTARFFHSTMSASGSQFSVFMEPKVNFEPQESDLTSVYRLLLSRMSSDTLVGVVERPLLLYTSFTQKKV